MEGTDLGKLFRVAMLFICSATALLFGIIGVWAFQSLLKGQEPNYCGAGKDCAWAWIDYAMCGAVVFVSSGGEVVFVMLGRELVKWNAGPGRAKGENPVTFKEWWPSSQLYASERSAALEGWDAGKAEGEKSGTAAERKRILGLLDAEVTILTERDIDLGRIRRAIEHPEPDAGCLK